MRQRQGDALLAALLPNGMDARALTLGGSALRRQGDPLTADVVALLWPAALAAAGLEATVAPLPAGRAEASAVLAAVKGRAALVRCRRRVPDDAESPVTRAAEVTWSGPAPARALPARGPDWMLLTTRRSRIARPAAVEWPAAVLRLAAFRAAFPGRLADADVRALQCQADWLRAVRHGASARVRRQAAAALDRHRPADAWAMLLEHVLETLRVQPAVRRALARADAPPSPTLLQELIYLARAGTPEFRTLAAARLAAWAAPEAADTLDQLAWDSHPWPRAAARAVSGE